MLKRFADQQLLKRNAELETELAIANRTVEIQAAEIQNLALVAARDRERVKAELAAYARQRAECEGTHGRTS